MRRLLWLPLAAALGVLAIGQRAPSQQGDDFGVLKPSPARPTASSPPPQALPAGVVPDRAAGPAAPARPVNPFPITSDAGPWMVCATTYVGPDGAELARQVTLELRNKHRLMAFIFNRGDEERQKQEAEHQERLKRLPPGTQLPRRFYRVQDQYAVLVGGFKDFAAASAYLPVLKKLPAPELKLEGGKSPYELMTYQEIDSQTQKEVTKAGRVHPFHLAMVVRNPAVPNAQPQGPKWDPLWKKLNADEEYSLLGNPKRYTLLVKEYQGLRAVQQQKGSSGFLSALGLGGNRPGEVLDATARQAHELAKFLRHPNHGMKAWVLHTRNSSLVCVGGFDGPDDPEYQRLRDRVAGLRFAPKGGGADPVGLMADPVPLEIPRP